MALGSFAPWLHRPSRRASELHILWPNCCLWTCWLKLASASRYLANVMRQRLYVSFCASSWPPVSLPCITRGTGPVSPGVPARGETCGCESVCTKSLRSCPTPCDPIGCSPSDSSVLGILQASTLSWIATPSSRGSSQPRDRTHLFFVSCIGRWVLHVSELDLNHSSEPHPSSLCVSHLGPSGPWTGAEKSLWPACELPGCVLTSIVQ